MKALVTMQGDQETAEELGQYFTPSWFAEAIIDRYFPDIHREQGIIEPSCGPGSFLGVLPEAVPVVGVEIDARLAAIARRHTGREVIVGDFRTVDLPFDPTLLIGNPPFSAEVIDGFFDRSHRILPDGGRLAMILPSYMLQTASRVAGYSERWSMQTEIIPRNIFPGLSKPLVFSIFTKDQRRTMIGMAFFLETHEKTQLAKPYRDLLATTRRQVWKAVCEVAIERLGGKASLQDIYRELEANRPTATKFWREKIRQTLQRYGDRFLNHGQGVYALA